MFNSNPADDAASASASGNNFNFVNSKISDGGTSRVTIEKGSKVAAAAINLGAGDFSASTGGKIVTEINGESGNRTKVVANNLTTYAATAVGSTAQNNIEVKSHSDVIINTLNMGNVVSGTGAGSVNFDVTGSYNALSIAAFNTLNAAGGTSSFTVGGGNNTLAFGTGGNNYTLAIAANGNSFASGSSNVEFGGVNNVIRVNGSGLETGITLGLSTNSSSTLASTLTFTGVGNELYTGRIFIGGNATRGGSANVYIKGDSAADKIKLYTNSLFLKGAGAASSGSGALEIAGNTILRGFDGTDASASSIQLGNDGAMLGGSAEIIISGTGNDLLFSSINLGHTNSTVGATLRVKGSGSLIVNTGNLSVRGASSTSFANHRGAMLEMVADATGFSSISVGGVDVFSGLLLVDFTNLVGSDIVTLISSSSDWETICTALVGDSNRVKLVMNEGDSASLRYDMATYSLVADFTSAIPEPGAYAAVFGSLAFAFAAYRRRKA